MQSYHSSTIGIRRIENTGWLNNWNQKHFNRVAWFPDLDLIQISMISKNQVWPKCQKIIITCGYPGGLRPRKPPSGMLIIPPGPAPAVMGGGPCGIFLDVPGISIIHRSLVFLGRRIKRKMGKYLRNRILIQLGIEWVLGPLQVNQLG